MSYLITIDPNDRESFAWVLGLLRPGSPTNRLAAHLVCRIRSLYEVGLFGVKRDATQSAQVVQVLYKTWERLSIGWGSSR